MFLRVVLKVNEYNVLKALLRFIKLTNIKDRGNDVCSQLFQPEINVNSSGDFCAGTQTNSDL